MPAPDLLLDLIQDVSAKLGGKPGTQRWEVITACFGWGALFALIGWLVAEIMGLENLASWSIGGFAFLFGIAFKRDLLKLVRTGRMTR